MLQVIRQQLCFGMGQIVIKLSEAPREPSVGILVADILPTQVMRDDLATSLGIGAPGTSDRAALRGPRQTSCVICVTDNVPIGVPYDCRCQVGVTPSSLKENLDAQAQPDARTGQATNPVANLRHLVARFGCWSGHYRPALGHRSAVLPGDT